MKLKSVNSVKCYLIGVVAIIIALVSYTMLSPALMKGTVNTPIDWDNYLPDIDKYIPDMSVYAVNAPEIAVPTVTLPSLDIPTNISEVTNVSSLSNVPSIDIIELPTIATAIPYTQLDTAYEGFFDGVEALDAVELEELTINVPNLDYISKDIAEGVRILKAVQSVFQDYRRIEHDNSIFTNENVTKWLQIYKDYKTSTIDYIPVTRPFRMISEVMVPKNNSQFDILTSNLSYYKAKGYNAVLIAFDGTENPYDLGNLVKFVRSKGFRAFFALGGTEKLQNSIFIDPAKLKNQLQALAQYSEGYITGWRSTSAHLFIQDDAYMNYIASCVREANPSCLILGELYYGNTHVYDKAHKWGFGLNNPKYSSGVVLSNFGFSAVNTDAIVKRVAPSKVGKKRLVGLVTGQRPYYLTKYPNKLGQVRNQTIKTKLEARFISAGCIGTVTLHDDGSNGIYNNKINNNLSETKLSSLI